MENTILQRVEIMSRLNAINDSPTICAIGAQNVGKSTIMNKIAGMEIFPSRKMEDTYSGAKTTMQVTVTSFPDKNHSVNFKQGNKEGNLEFKNKKEMLVKIYEILNGQQSNKDVLDKTVHLSPEPLNITIRCPDIYPFHFTDTPGIVSNDINKNKATTYIVERCIVNKKNTIVLFFINAGDDWANTPGWNLVTKEGVCTENVVVVFTKPDNASADGKGVYEGMHSGLDWISPENVFVVKGADTHRGDNMILTDEQEMSFFKNNTSYYKKLLTECPNRIGVRNLVLFLKNKLDTICCRALPDIISTLESNLYSLRQEETMLGQEISDNNKGAVVTNALLVYSINLREKLNNTKLLDKLTKFNLTFPLPSGADYHSEANKYIQETYKAIQLEIKNAIPEESLLDINFWERVEILLISSIDYRKTELEVSQFINQLNNFNKYKNGTLDMSKAINLVLPSFIFQYIIRPIIERDALHNIIDKNYDSLLLIAKEKESIQSKRSLLKQQIMEKEKAINVMRKFKV